MKLRGILLDRDGTIVDLHAPFLRIAQQAAALFAEGDTGIEIALLRAAGCDAGSGRMGIGCVFAAGTCEDVIDVWAPLLPFHNATLLQARIEAIGERVMAEAEAIDQVLDAIGILKSSGLVLGIATNATAASTRASVARLGLGGSMSFIAGCDSGHGAKPGPGMATAFCASSGLKPEEVAIIGDTPHDIRTGRNAGLGLCVGVLSGAGTEADLSEADIVLPSLADMPAYLQSRASGKNNSQIGFCV
ncbi:MAG: HAD family hydrolase [Parvibaculaceae bacterium]